MFILLHSEFAIGGQFGRFGSRLGFQFGGRFGGRYGVRFGGQFGGRYGRGGVGGSVVR